VEPTIDLDAGDVIEVGGARQPPWTGRPWLWRLSIVVVLAVVAALIVYAHRSGSTPTAAPASASAPQATGPQATGPQAPASTGLPTPLTGIVAPGPTVTEAGPGMLGVTAAWDLYARSDQGIARIEFASGRITVTPVPELQSTGPVSFVAGGGAGGGWVLDKPLDSLPGYLLHDGSTPQNLPATFGQVFPGPDPAHIWVDVNDGTSEYLALAGPDGRTTSARITVPNDMIGSARSDGAGYVVLSGFGGTYDARPGGLTRVTTGTVLASGPHTWLTTDCDDHHVCSDVVTNRTTGARTVLTHYHLQSAALPGLIAPNGRAAAIVVPNADGTVNVHVINLWTGADWSTNVDVSTQGDPSSNGSSMVWSPDGTWLFVADGDGSLRAVNVATETIQAVDTPIRPIVQVAIGG
jgi:hypothetical protein